MHNVGVIRVSRMLGVSVAALALSGSLLTGCSFGEGGSDADPAPSASSSPVEPYLPVPDGVVLTEPGSELPVGENAIVAYRPRQGEVGVLNINVTRLEKTSVKAAFSAWQLSEEQEKSTPYYVHATVENVGDTDLGGRPVPLYVVNEHNVLLEATPFASAFEPCPSAPFPDKFRHGDRAKVCLVYLAPDHGDLVAVSFRPEETFTPITWTGEVREAKAGEKADAERKKGNKPNG